LDEYNGYLNSLYTAGTNYITAEAQGTQYIFYFTLPLMHKNSSTLVDTEILFADYITAETQGRSVLFVLPGP
jgi:hypothetical protein